MPLTIEEVYERLFAAYGPQGWWPLLDCRGTNPTSSGTFTGYHPGDYSWPHTDAQRFEICIGAILTQNTAWPNVEKALYRLRERDLLSPDALLRVEQEELEECIRPSGYFRVKARKLREFAAFYRGLRGRTPSREELLAVWGVGPETADSMLLYAWARPEMVVDAYTRRILVHAGIVPAGASLAEIRRVCAAGLPESVPVFQEFHALMVEHGKRCYSRKPWHDPLLLP